MSSAAHQGINNMYKLINIYNDKIIKVSFETRKDAFNYLKNYYDNLYYTSKTFPEFLDSWKLSTNNN